jgi:hypothetical protein
LRYAGGIRRIHTHGGFAATNLSDGRSARNGTFRPPQFNKGLETALIIGKVLLPFPKLVTSAGMTALQAISIGFGNLW